MIKVCFGKICIEYQIKMNISQKKFIFSISMDRIYYSYIEASREMFLYKY